MTIGFVEHVVAFSEEISRIRSGWDEKPGEDPKGLLLFSGDAFSPSVESMLTNGRNMVCYCELDMLCMCPN